ncbi:spore coat protein GerQ [Paenibacillus sp. J5C2022]|uniref:spore coat protein GerQ n=1 Tax=Paenibacillus sp. J5C2022 TaxID=2977129 RepID=UPI00397D7122
MGPSSTPNVSPLATAPNTSAYAYGGGFGGYGSPYAPMGGMSMQSAATPPVVPSGSYMQGGAPAREESYIENILRLNRGKMATFYMTYENNREWNAKIFKGVIEAAGRDHIVISDPSTGMRYLLLMLNLDYVTFNEQINYEYPFNGQTITQSTPLNA